MWKPGFLRATRFWTVPGTRNDGETAWCPEINSATCMHWCDRILVHLKLCNGGGGAVLLVVGGGEVLPPLLLCMVFRQKKEKSRPPGPSGCARASAAACDDLLRSPLRPILTFFNAASRGPWAVSASARAQGRGRMKLAGLQGAGRGREGGDHRGLCTRLGAPCPAEVQTRVTVSTRMLVLRPVAWRTHVAGARGGIRTGGEGGGAGPQQRVPPSRQPRPRRPPAGLHRRRCPSPPNPLPCRLDRRRATRRGRVKLTEGEAWRRPRF